MPMITTKTNTHHSMCLIFKDSELLVKAEKPVELSDEKVLQKCFEQNYAKDWFTEPEKDYTTAILEEGAPTPAKHKWIRLRELFATNDPVAPTAARALALLKWRRTARFCGCCGGPLQDDKYETARVCPLCGNVVFPRISPAIIILVSKGDKILLARHATRNTDLYTCLAGFMEHGENIEECARREVKEETGIEIENIRYCSSQAWPYPDQLMIALRADWKSGDLVLQESEIDDAKWFSRDNLPPIPKPGSVAYKLITGAL